MMPLKLKLSNEESWELQRKLLKTQQAGDLQTVKRFLAILSLGKGSRGSDIAQILQVTIEAIKQWVVRYLTKGMQGLINKKKPGRKSNLTKTQRKELSDLLKQGPEACGFPGGCWRSPMIQHLIYEKFGVFYNVRYISELLKNLGFSYQKAQFIADKRDAEKREEWLKTKWIEITTLAAQKNAMILFGDEASFPQWGTLNYTWAPVGQTPTIKTSGIRKGFKVFGLIDYFTGRFFSKGVEGKLNGERYIEFLQEILQKTTKHIALIQDGASYHRGKLVKEFFKNNSDRITVYQLPSYSPDFNPIEKLWKKIKQKGTHLKYFPTFDSLKEKVNEMLVEFKNIPEEILSLFGLYKKLS